MSTQQMSYILSNLGTVCDRLLARMNTLEQAYVNLQNTVNVLQNTVNVLQKQLEETQGGNEDEGEPDATGQDEATDGVDT